EELFSDRAYMHRFKYLKDHTDAKKSDDKHLPLGFAVERSEGKQDWVGYTCAACHTNDIKFKGVRMRIDGAPTLADFQGFVTELARALKKTVNDEAAFKRFAKHVDKSNKNDPVALATLRSELQQFETKYAG